MLLDSSTICKPLIERELFFYLNIPEELHSFAPHYKGKKNCVFNFNDSHFTVSLLLEENETTDDACWKSST